MNLRRFTQIIVFSVWISIGIVSAQDPTPTLLPPPPTPELTLPNETVADWHSLLSADQGNCYLPCWNGISPNETNLAEAFDIINVHFPRAYWKVNEGRFIEVGIHLTSSLVTNNASSPPRSLGNITLQEKNGLISSIEIFTWNPFSSANHNWEGIWDYYSVVNLLETYGVPNDIGLIFLPDMQLIDPPYQGLVADDLTLVWNELGLLVKYSHHANPQLSRTCFKLGQLSGLFIKIQDEPYHLDYFREYQSITHSSDLSLAEMTRILIEHEGCLPQEIVHHF